MKRTTFQDFDKQWYFCLTDWCNWQCGYCDFSKKMWPNHADIGFVEETFETIKRVTKRDQSIEYCFEGGEIGLLPEAYLDRVFATDLADTYNIATNGLFMEKGYHEKFKGKIHYILYHVLPEIQLDKPIIEYETFDYLCYYTFVIHKHNLDILDEFLKRNAHVKTYFQPHILQPRTPGLDLLTHQDFKRLYSILHPHDNIKPDFKERVARIIRYYDDEEWLDKKRRVCANVYTQPVFDMPNKNINRCCISITGDAVPVTEENINKLYTNKKLYSTLKDKVCDGCIANFLWHDFRHKKYFKEVVGIYKEFACSTKST